MKIKYITGRASSGKSRTIFEEIKKTNAQATTCILIVPEQFTLQAEYDLIAALGTQGLMGIDVCSFSSLSRLVIEETGGYEGKQILSGEAKMLMMAKAAVGVRDDLQIYRRVSHSPGFVDSVCEIVQRLKSEKIAPDVFRQNFGDLKDMNHAASKIRDISWIYEEYEKLIKESFLDDADELALLGTRLQSSDMVQNAHIWIDGFTALDSMKIGVICSLLQTAGNVSLSVNIDFAGENRDAEVFLAGKRMYNRVHKAVSELGYAEEILACKQGEAYIGEKAPGIAHLEKEIFSYPFNVYTDNNHDALFMHEAMNPEQEIRFAADYLISSIRDNGWRYRDYAVICGDIDQYGSAIKRIFSEVGIPLFMDERRPALGSSLCEAFLALLEVIENNFKREDVCRFMKTGYAAISREDSDIMENYLLAKGIRGRSRWQKPFVQPEQSTVLNELETDENDLSAEEKIRQAFITCFELVPEALSSLKKTTYKECTSVLVGLAEAFGFAQTTGALIQRLQLNGLVDKAQELEQIWKMLVQIFSQLQEVLADEPASIQEYRLMLEAAFGSIDVGVLPSTIDQVLIGDARRWISGSPKVLIVLGAVDGVFPRVAKNHGILNDADILYINEQVGIDIGNDTESENAQELYATYSALARPSQQICLCYPLADNEGKSLRASSVIARIREIFPQITITSDLHADSFPQIAGNSNALFARMPEIIRCKNEVLPCDVRWNAVIEWFSQSEKWQDRFMTLKNSRCYDGQKTTIGKDLSSKLYQLPLRISASRLEIYAKCKFAHFIHYGLGAAERDEYVLGMPDIGDFYHRCLREFSIRIKQLDLSQLSEERVQEIFDTCVDELAAEYEEGIFKYKDSYGFMLSRMRDAGKRAAWRGVRAVQGSAFRPAAFEASFDKGAEGTLPEINMENKDAYICGRMDRIDIAQTDEQKMVRVIDYKTGSKKFMLETFFEGVDLQLAIYMAALAEGYKDAIVAGCYYFPLGSATVNLKEADEDDVMVQQQIAENFSMSGFTCNAEAVTAATGNEQMIKSAAKFTPEEMELINAWCLLLAQDFVEGMLQGEIDKNPIELKTEGTSCTYCPYNAACLFENGLYGDVFRRIRFGARDRDDIFKAMRARLEWEAAQ